MPSTVAIDSVHQFIVRIKLSGRIEKLGRSHFNLSENNVSIKIKDMFKNFFKTYSIVFSVNVEFCFLLNFLRDSAGTKLKVI